MLYKVAANALGIEAVGECPYCCWNGGADEVTKD